MMKLDPFDERRMQRVMVNRKSGDVDAGKPVPRAERDNFYENEDFIDVDFSINEHELWKFGDSISFHRFVGCRFWYSRISVRAALSDDAFLRCDFHGATFYGSNYAESCFVGSSFTDASMTNCDFYLDDFKRCTFAGADLSGSRFFGCDLRDVDFTGANLDGCIFCKCAYADDVFEGALGASLNERYTDKRALALFDARSEEAKAAKAPSRPFATLDELSFPFNLTALDKSDDFYQTSLDLQRDNSVPEGTDTRVSSLDTYAEPLPEEVDPLGYLKGELEKAGWEEDASRAGRDQLGMPQDNPRNGFECVPWVKAWREADEPYKMQVQREKWAKEEEEKERKKQEEIRKRAEKEAEAKRQIEEAKARYEASQRNKSTFSKLFGKH